MKNNCKEVSVHIESAIHEGICGWRVVRRKVGRRKAERRYAERRKAGRSMSSRRPVRSRLVRRMVGSVLRPGM